MDNKDKKYEKDAEELVNHAFGTDVFERAEKPVKKDNSGSEKKKNETAKVVKKWKDQSSHEKKMIKDNIIEAKKMKTKTASKKSAKVGASEEKNKKDLPTKPLAREENKKNMEQPKSETEQPVVKKKEESDKLLSQAEAKRREEELLGKNKEGSQEKVESAEKESVVGGGNEADVVEKEKIKTKEEILEEARGEFAKTDLLAEKYIKAQKKLKGEKTKKDFEGTEGAGKEYSEAREKYFGALKIQREKMLEDGTKKIEALNLPKEKKDKEMKKLLSEIVKETAARESGRLHDKKAELGLELKGGEGKFEKILNVSKKVVEKYRKMPLKYKLMLSAGLFAGGVAAGAVGGAVGATMVTGVVAGRWFQRVLGGSAAAVGIEALWKKKQEKKTEKRVSAEFADMSIEAIKNNDEQLNKRLLELEGGKKREKYRRFALAGSVGALIMSGWTAKAFGAIIPDEWADWMKDKVGLGAEAAPTKEALMKSEIVSEGMGAEKVAEAGVGFVETAEKGDSVWKMAEDQLEKHYGERFSDLDPAQKTYAIDAIKDKIAANPKMFGLDDIDKLKIGQKVDFSSIINDEKNLDNIFNHAEGLSQAALDNIEAGKGVVNIELGGSAGLMGESLGFSPEEYNAIKGVKVGKLLEQIPSKEKAWEVWRDTGKKIDLPHDGVYGVSEFNKHIKLAELIRNSGSVEGIENMTVAEALEKIQGSAGVLEASDMATGAGEAELWKGTPELEAADKAPGAGEARERVANIELDESPAKEIKPISTEKVVESLTGRDKEIKDLLLGRGINNVTDQLKTGKISSNEFANFCAHNLGASKGVNSELYQNIKTNIENLKSSDNIKSGKANRALKVILQRILAK